MRLVREVLPTLNNGQFLELLPLFSDETKRLFFFMTVEQAVVYREAILAENGSLLMRIFLGELATVQRENDVSLHDRPLKHRKTRDRSDRGSKQCGENEIEDEGEDRTASPTRNQLIPELFFHPESRLPSKQYGLSTNDLTKALKNQLLRFVEHVTKAINLNRSGSKISLETAEEQKATFLR